MVFSLLSPLWPSFIKENVAACPEACFTTFYEAACISKWCCLCAAFILITLSRLAHVWCAAAIGEGRYLDTTCSLLRCLFIQLISGEGLQR